MNLTQEEISALKSLKKNKNLAVLRGDKGNVTVLMDKKEVEEKIGAQLNNVKKYLPGPADPIKEFGGLVKECVNNLKKSGAVSTKVAKELLVLNPQDPFVFTNVKVHKPNNPLRLISL